jgi:outer membrane protein
VEALTEQLKRTRNRFNVGEVTRTDVAQAESRLAAGRSQLLSAQSQYKSTLREEGAGRAPLAHHKCQAISHEGSG